MQTPAPVELVALRTLPVSSPDGSARLVEAGQLVGSVQAPALVAHPVPRTRRPAMSAH